MCLRWKKNRCVCASRIHSELPHCLFLCLFMFVLNNLKHEKKNTKTYIYLLVTEFGLWPEPCVVKRFCLPPPSLEQWAMRVTAQVKWPKVIVQAARHLVTVKRNRPLGHQVYSPILVRILMYTDGEIKRYHTVSQLSADRDMRVCVCMHIHTQAGTHIQAR